jgi:hypothetical protein
MALQRNLEFFIVSYRPNVIANGKLNVGLLAIERAGKFVSFSAARFIPEVKAVLAFDENADVECLRATLQEIDLAFREPDKAIVLLNEILDSFVSPLSISDGQAVMFSGEPTAEVERLAAEYIRAA